MCLCHNRGRVNPLVLVWGCEVSIKKFLLWMGLALAWQGVGLLLWICPADGWTPMEVLCTGVVGVIAMLCTGFYGDTK